MSLGNIIKDKLDSYFSFKGRFDTEDFWIQHIRLGIGIFTLIFIEKITDYEAYFLYFLGYALMAIMILSAWVRRLHDLGHSGWFVLLGPGNPIMFLYLAFWSGKREPNIYGDSVEMVPIRIRRQCPHCGKYDR